jgi:hypothetical protein
VRIRDDKKLEALALCQEPSWNENMELRVDLAIIMVLPQRLWLPRVTEARGGHAEVLGRPYHTWLV